MMGRQRWDQGRLFYEFRLEDRIPEHHLLRRIDVFVTTALADLHKGLESFYRGIRRRRQCARGQRQPLPRQGAGRTRLGRA